MSGMWTKSGLVALLASMVMLGAPNDAAGMAGGSVSFGGGASKTPTGWVADLRALDANGCPDLGVICFQLTGVRWRPVGGGSVDDFDRHLRSSAADDFSLDTLDPGGAGSGGGNWSFLNIGPSLNIPFNRYGAHVGLNLYYQVEWLTTAGLQASHIVGAEFQVVEDGGGKLGVEWQTHGDASAINLKLMFMLGYYDR